MGLDRRSTPLSPIAGSPGAKRPRIARHGFVVAEDADAVLVLHVVVMERGGMWWSACLIMWSRVGLGRSLQVCSCFRSGEGFEDEHEGKLVCLFELIWGRRGGEVDAG